MRQVTDLRLHTEKNKLKTTTSLIHITIFCKQTSKIFINNIEKIFEMNYSKDADKLNMRVVLLTAPKSASK